MAELPYGASTTRTIAVSQNRVLRNTYLLLAISLVPTVIGAFLGLQFGFSRALVGSPWISLIVFLAGAWGLMYMIERNKHSSAGIGWLMAFTLFMGVMLSRMLGMVLGMSNGAALIGYAAGGTGLIFFGMASLATVVKRDLSGMGKFLLIGVLVLFVAWIINMIWPMPALTLTLLVVGLGVFSALLMYDIHRIINGGETNYISATLAIYLDIYNIFQNLLALLGIFGGNDD